MPRNTSCCVWCGHRTIDHRGEGGACICGFGLVACTCSGADPAVPVTVDELAALIEASDPDHPVHATWGTGKVRGDAWTMAELERIRSVKVASR